MILGILKMPIATTLKESHRAIYTLSVQYMFPNPLETQLERGKRRIISSGIGEEEPYTQGSSFLGTTFDVR